MLLIALCSSVIAAADRPQGDSVIRGPALGSEIVITTTSRVAGAIHSLTWNGKEFLDSADHGRQMQSASNFDAGGPFVPEVFNPTEAGSMSDGAGETSTSRLLSLSAKGRFLETKSQMAFWLRPGEKSQGHPARNPAALSHHLLKKRVEIGYRDLPNVISYDVTFTVPEGERHTYAQFEAVTGYMPMEFSRFETFDPKSGELGKLDDGPGEQAKPVVFSTPDGHYAMGCDSPDQPSPGYETAGYGRFRFAAEKVVKWNIVFRLRNADGVPAGDYRYRNFVVVGDRQAVRETLIRLRKSQKP